jgi:putative N6-adenine-specific DNA methylase
MKEREYIATTLEGLEPVLEEELKLLGGRNLRQGKRNVAFTGDNEMMYRACYTLRTAMRVLKPLAGFKIRNEDDLYQNIVSLPWRKILGPDQTLAVTSVVHSEIFPHTTYPGLVTKDAICDRIRKEVGRRPNVDKERPDIRVNLHIHENTVDISLDAGGSSLHQRGYRRFGGQAPLNEVLAAGLLRLADWKPEQPLLDPMCGSATLLIEAAEWVAGRPAQIRRGHFGFQGWLDFDPGLWRRIKLEYRDAVLPDTLKLKGSDIDDDVLDAGRSNIRIAGMGEVIMTEVADFFSLPKSTTPGMIIMNPPYDERLSLEEVSVFYRKIGDKLKQDFEGSVAWILSANKEGLKNVGLKTAQRHLVKNGPLDAEFCRYDLY